MIIKTISSTLAVPARIKSEGIALNCCEMHEATDDILCNQLSKANPECCDLCNHVEKGENFFFKYVTKDKLVALCVGQMGNDFVEYSTLYWLPDKNTVSRIQPRVIDEDEPIVIHEWFPEGYETPNTVRTSSGDIVITNNHILTAVNNKLDSISIHDLKNDYLSFSPLTKRPQRPKQGTIFFNKNKKCLECYDGSTWRALW